MRGVGPPTDPLRMVGTSENGINTGSLRGETARQSVFHGHELLPPIIAAGDASLICDLDDSYAKAIGRRNDLRGARYDDDVLRARKIPGIVDDHAITIQKQSRARLAAKGRAQANPDS